MFMLILKGLWKYIYISIYMYTQIKHIVLHSQASIDAILLAIIVIALNI